MSEGLSRHQAIEAFGAQLDALRGEAAFLRRDIRKAETTAGATSPHLPGLRYALADLEGQLTLLAESLAREKRDTRRH